MNDKFPLFVSIAFLTFTMSPLFAQAPAAKSPLLVYRTLNFSPNQNQIRGWKMQGAGGVAIPFAWKQYEFERERCNWAQCKQQLAAIRTHRLEWISVWNLWDGTQLPDWFAGKFGSQYTVCLEHGRAGQNQSLWNPAMRQHAARFLKAFGANFRSALPNTVLLDLPTFPRNVKAMQGTHTHSGYWCGDPFAAESFRIWLIRRYGGNSPLRDAWGEFRDLNTVTPFGRDQAPNLQAWADMTQWYADSQTTWAKFVLQEARKSLPFGRVALRIPLSLHPEDAQNLLALIQMSVQIGGAVCFVVANDAESLGLLEMALTAAKSGNPQCRILIDKSQSSLSLAALTQRIPLGQCAALIVNASEKGNRSILPKLGTPAKEGRPQAAVCLPAPGVRQESLTAVLNSLSLSFSCHLLDERAIAGGALAQEQVLILPQRPILARNTWERIVFWLKSGGTLRYHKAEQPTLIEGESEIPEALWREIKAHSEPLPNE